MKENKVSVIIPSYNRGNKIKKSIYSVLNQTYSNLEVIVVDDGSTDDTKNVIKSIIQEDSRVRYVYQENQGAPTARNRGIDESQGEYIAFNDSDDTWLPTKLEKQVNILNNNKTVDVVFCKLRSKKDTGDIQLMPDNQVEGTDISNLVGIGTQTLIGRKEVFQKYKFDSQMPRFQELELLMRITRDCSVYSLDEGLVNYNLSSDSISGSVSKMLEANELILKKHPDVREKFPQTAKSLSGVAYIAGRELLHKKDLEKANLCLKQSIKLEPKIYRKILKKLRIQYLKLSA